MLLPSLYSFAFVAVAVVPVAAIAIVAAIESVTVIDSVTVIESVTVIGSVTVVVVHHFDVHLHRLKFYSHYNCFLNHILQIKLCQTYLKVIRIANVQTSEQCNCTCPSS